jgi:hypothetical protein
LQIIHTPPDEHIDPDTKPTRQGKLAEDTFQLKEIYASLLQLKRIEENNKECNTPYHSKSYQN